MRCPVCYVTWNEQAGTACPQCGYDAELGGTSDPATLLKLREAFKQKSTAFAPNSRVTPLDKAKPWLGLLLGFVLFVFWLRACSSMGWRLF